MPKSLIKNRFYRRLYDITFRNFRLEFLSFSEKRFKNRVEKCICEFFTVRSHGCASGIFILSTCGSPEPRPDLARSGQLRLSIATPLFRSYVNVPLTAAHAFSLHPYRFITRLWWVHKQMGRCRIPNTRRMLWPIRYSSDVKI